MAAAPDEKRVPEQEPGGPMWLGSVARRGGAETHGAGWTEEKESDEAQPRWLGSVARREGTKTDGDGWAEPGPEGPRWLGSVARRGDTKHLKEKEGSGAPVKSLYLVDIEGGGSEASEASAAPQDIGWEGSGGRARLNHEHESSLSEPLDEVGERRERYVIGALGMRLRIVA